MAGLIRFNDSLELYSTIGARCEVSELTTAAPCGVYEKGPTYVDRFNSNDHTKIIRTSRPSGFGVSTTHMTRKQWNKLIHMLNGNMDKDKSSSSQSAKINRYDLVELEQFFDDDVCNSEEVYCGERVYNVLLYYGYVPGLGLTFSTDAKQWSEHQITVPVGGRAAQLVLLPLIMDCDEVDWDAHDIKLVSCLLWGCYPWRVRRVSRGINGNDAEMDCGLFFNWSEWHAALAKMWNKLMHARNGNSELLPIILPILIREAPHLIASVIESLAPSAKAAQIGKELAGGVSGLPVANVVPGRNMNSVLKDIVTETGSRLMDREDTAVLGGLLSLVGPLFDRKPGESPKEEEGACLLCDVIDGMSDYGDRLRAVGIPMEESSAHNQDMHAQNGNSDYAAMEAARHNKEMHALNGNGDSREAGDKLKSILEEAQKKTEEKTKMAEKADGLDDSPLASGKANEVSGSSQIEEGIPAWIEEMSAKTLGVTGTANYNYDYNNLTDFIVSWWHTIRNSFTIERNNVARTRACYAGHRFMPSLQRDNVPANVILPLFVPIVIGESGHREGPEITLTEAFRTALASLVNSASQQVTGSLRVNNNLTSGNIMQMMGSLVSENLRNRIGTSVADILLKWVSYMSMSVPINRGTDSFVANTGIRWPNPINAGWGPTAYPLSIAIVRPLPAASISAVHCTLAQFALVAGGYSPAIAGWEPETWGNTVAVVPMTMRMLNGGTKNITWTVLHLEFPFSMLTYNAALEDSGGNALIANCIPFASSNLWRMSGPTTRIIYVQVENNTTTLATTLIGGAPLVAGNSLIGGAPLNLGIQFEAWLTTGFPLSLHYWRQMSDYLEGMLNKKDWLDAILLGAELSVRYSAPRVRTGVTLENAHWNNEVIAAPFPVLAGTFTAPTAAQLADIYGCQTTPLGNIPLMQGGDSVAYRIGRHQPIIYIAHWARFFSFSTSIPSHAKSPFTVAALLDTLSFVMAVSYDRIVERAGVPYRTMMGTGLLPDPGGGDILFDNVQDLVLMYLNGINPDRTFKPLYPNRYGAPTHWLNLFPIANLNAPWMRIPKPLASTVYEDSYYCVDEVSKLDWASYRSITLNIGGLGLKSWFILNYSIDDWTSDKLRQTILKFVASGGYTQFNGNTDSMAIVDVANVETALFSTGWTTPLPMINTGYGNYTVIVQNQDTIEVPIIAMPPVVTARGSDRLMNFAIDQHLPFFGPSEFGERLCVRRFGFAPINRTYADSSRISATTLRSKLFRQKT